MPLLSGKQLEANRRNAQKSTGPRTMEGKERSRANATTHGLTAIATIYRPLRHENPDDFIELRAKLTDEFKPATTAEHLAIEMAASAYKRMQRAEAMESAYFDGAMAAIQNRNGQKPHKTGNDDLGSAIALGDKHNKLTWENLDKYRRSAWLDYNRSLDQLRKLQRERVESELRELRLHEKRENYLRKTHVATERAVRITSSASFRHRQTADRLLKHRGRHSDPEPSTPPSNAPAGTQGKES